MTVVSSNAQFSLTIRPYASMRWAVFQAPICQSRLRCTKSVLLTIASKSFLEALGNKNLYKMLDGFDDKSADFVCTVACTAGAGQEVVVFKERMTVGAIGWRNLKLLT